MSRISRRRTRIRRSALWELPVRFQGGPDGAARAADPGRRGRAPAAAPARPASGARPAGAKSETRGRGNPGKSRSRGGFDTGTPRGGSIGLTRATWNAARSRTSVQPPPPCQIRRSARAVGVQVAAAAASRDL